MEFTVTPCPTTILRQTARNRELSGLRHAVVNHFLGSKNAALTANENNSSPILLLHPGDISTAEAYTAEHIDLEDVAPILVGNFIERLGLINSEVVNENVHRGKKLEQVFSCRSCGQVSGKSLDFRRGHSLPNLFQREVNCVIRTSVHDHTSTSRSKLASNGETDAGLVLSSRRMKREK